MTYPAVVDVKPNEDFSLNITFNTGQTGVLDMKPYLDFGVFQQLQEYARFERVRVSFDTIEWENDLDLDPEFVYAHCQGTIQ